MRKRVILLLTAAVAGGIWIIVSLNRESVNENRERTKAPDQELSELEEMNIYSFLQHRLDTYHASTVEVFGSSVAAGTGADSYSESWAGRLEERLQRITDGSQHVELNNHGVNGYSSKDMLERGMIDAELSGEADFVIIETGILNDFYRGIPAAQSIDNIHQLIREAKAKAPDAEVLVMNPNPAITYENTNPELDSGYQEFADQLKEEFERDQGVLFIDASVPFHENAENGRQMEQYIGDGIHPNREGYRLWYEHMDAYFEQTPVQEAEESG
ncbi:SGNH/GDSL hydrolase family protein [Marinococcus luteus]|uniref:SGNH/GDSL hydrolase family protein n=1 Tax=Marinococcus luteus TaxID=1122204 RepID=UPI002ACCF7C4|nr:SGNH/GDSL hydrolase family protein [Marinococcus luteus]MDZ5783523.1 SGNH/GDSL hydrolase family protein [Marinococcus luteus]